MSSLSSGFCASALNSSFTLEKAELWRRAWGAPTLQVLDIQRFPKKNVDSSTISRFYVAASDGASVIYLVITPFTEIEKMISDFQIDIGCCVTLHDFSVVSAANGFNVVVPVRISCSPDPLSLQGNPQFDAALFALSSRALTRQQQQQQQLEAGAGKHSSCTDVCFRDILEDPQCVLNEWRISVRILWKGSPYRLPSTAGQPQQRQSHSGRLSDTLADARAKYIVHLVAVDPNGDAATLSFIGTEGASDYVAANECVQLSGGSVRWTDDGRPLKLQFTEKSSISFLGSGEERQLPHLPTAFPFAQKPFVTVEQVMDSYALEDAADVVGFVVGANKANFVNTKRGRVLRQTLRLADDAAGGSEGIELTLWGDLAERVDVQWHEKWLFENCLVKEFMRKKTLSSRASTTAIKLMDAPGARPTAAASTASLTTVAAAVTEPVAATPLATAAAQEEADGSTGTEVSLSLLECSQTLPALVRIQFIRFPTMRWQCTRCLRETAPREACPSCDSSEMKCVFYVVLEVSDGVDFVEAVACSAVCESLFSLSEKDYAARLLEDATFERSICSSLVGTPVLMWLLASEVGYSVVHCKHVGFAFSAAVVLKALEKL